MLDGAKQIATPSATCSSISSTLSLVGPHRGSDPSGDGMKLDGYTVTLDAGCGYGGPLIAAAIMPDGRIVDMIKA